MRCGVLGSMGWRGISGVRGGWWLIGVWGGVVDCCGIQMLVVGRFGLIFGRLLLDGIKDLFY